MNIKIESLLACQTKEKVTAMVLAQGGYIGGQRDQEIKVTHIYERLSSIERNAPPVHYKGKEKEGGMTLLHTAVQAGRLYVVQGLIDAGADIDLLVADDLGFIPLHWAVSEGGILIGDNRSWGGKKLYIAGAPAEHAKIIEYLLQTQPQEIKQAMLEAKTKTGYQAIHLAVDQDRPAAALALGNNGADINAIYEQSQAFSSQTTPLMLALKQQNVPMAKLLLTYPEINPKLGSSLEQWSMRGPNNAYSEKRVDATTLVQHHSELAPLVAAKIAAIEQQQMAQAAVAAVPLEKGEVQVAGSEAASEKVERKTELSKCKAKAVDSKEADAERPVIVEQKNAAQKSLLEKISSKTNQIDGKSLAKSLAADAVDKTGDAASAAIDDSMVVTGADAVKLPEG